MTNPNPTLTPDPALTLDSAVTSDAAFGSDRAVQGRRFGLRTSEVSGVLRDHRFDRSSRLIRLQGWRGRQIAEAAAAGWAHRLAPGLCSVLALAGAVTGSVTLLVFTMATAVVGVFASNHPAEIAYNAWARRSGGAPIPANRAAKRLACALGTIFLGSAALAFAADMVVAGRFLAGSMGLVAGFVAVTTICIPSLIFTLVWGSQRATSRRLFMAEPR